MFARSGKFLMIVTLVTTLGAHWAILQSIAWATMLAENLCQKSVAEAMTQTFDGQHPCPLCQAIAAGKKTEKKTEYSAASQKMEFPPASAEISLIAPSPFRVFSPGDTFAKNLPPEPPFRPPRLFFV